MLWTALGLLIATFVSIEEAVTSEKPRGVKVLVGLLALAGAIVGTASAVSENKDKRSAERSVEALTRELGTQRKVLELVNLTVGDLGTLNQLSDGHKYYVRIAAGKTREELTDALNRIENQFPGAKSSHLAGIRDPRPGSTLFELVFGQHLDPAAAEVFSRLATSSHFTPKGEPAAIQRESN
jgi:hypothetical protein